MLLDNQYESCSIINFGQFSVFKCLFEKRTKIKQSAIKKKIQLKNYNRSFLHKCIELLKLADSSVRNYVLAEFHVWSPCYSDITQKYHLNQIFFEHVIYILLSYSIFCKPLKLSHFCIFFSIFFLSLSTTLFYHKNKI